MKQCWDILPSARPQFTAIVSKLEQIMPLIVKTSSDEVSVLPSSYSSYATTSSSYSSPENISATAPPHIISLDKAEDEGNAPPSFICPISKRVMNDPVMTVDGQTYERKAVEAWYAEHKTSFISGKTVTDKTVIPNYALHSAIVEWRSTRSNSEVQGISGCATAAKVDEVSNTANFTSISIY